MVTKLGFALPVKNEGIVGATSNRPSVQPALAIIHTPEGYAAYFAFMPSKYFEKPLVIVCLLR